MADYVLKPRAPARAFFVSAVVTLAGAVYLVIVISNKAHTGVIVLASAILATGLFMFTGTVASLRTMRVHVKTTVDGYSITGPKVNHSGLWSSVTKAVSADGGARLILQHGAVERTHIWAPLGGEDEQMKALMADVAKRLDADRGYRNPL